MNSPAARVEDVSVILLNHNHARYLPRAVEGVLRQTVRPRELLIIDDASTDDSGQVLQRLAQQDPLIRLVHNETNLGVEQNNNRALRMVSGEYVILAAADDQLLPRMIERTMALLRAHPQAGIACGYLSFLHESDGRIEDHCRWREEPCFLAGPELAEIMGGDCVPTTSAVIRRPSLLRAGGHCPELRWHADWFANLLIAFREGLCYIPKTLALFSVRESSYSAAGTRDLQAQQQVMAVLLHKLLSQEYADVLPLFQASGVMAGFGRSLVRAAAELAQRWTPAVLALLDGMAIEVYQDMLDDAEAEVRALARFLLGPMWRRRQQELAHLRHEADRLHRFQASPAGRLWRFLGRTKGVFGRLAG